MTPDQFETALRGYCRRIQFVPFLVEFASGNQILVSHREVIGPLAGLYVLRRPDRGYEVFASVSVARLVDLPISATA